LILKGASIFVYVGKAAVGWHLCEIRSFENGRSKIVLHLSKRDGHVTLLMYAACAMVKCQKRLGTFPCSTMARAMCRRLLTEV